MPRSRDRPVLATEQHRSPRPGSLKPTRTARMRRSAADVAAAAWGSFLAACLGSLLFFAVIDPGRLGEASDWLVDVDRMTGYGVCFFFFWLVSATGAAITLLLVRTSRSEQRRRARARLGAAHDGGGERAG